MPFIFVTRPRAFAVAFMLATAALACQAAENAPAPPARTHQLLLGLGYSAPFNLEEPFINMAQTRAADWTFRTKARQPLEGASAVASGFLDPSTYMPTKKSGAADYASAGMFIPGAENFRDYYADTYVLDWKGDAYGMMQRWERAEGARTDNRVTYKLAPFEATGGSLRFRSVGDDFGSVRLYRQKYEALLDRGEVWNPDFIAYARRYDIVRTMDIQSTNNIQVRRFDQIAAMHEPWGQRATMSWPEPPFFSAPYEILFELGVKADVKIWLTIPPQIGAPISPANPSLRKEGKKYQIDAARFVAATAAHAKDTLESPEWDIFAREFADRYLASGYPLDRPLYVEIGNEIWNFRGGFLVSTNYAIGIAKGIDPKGNIGRGYGVLMARFMLALEREFARRKARPNVVYVIASHVANPWRTKQALEGFSDYVRAAGGDPKVFLAKTGVAVTNYYGHFDPLSKALFGTENRAEYVPLWLEAIRENPDELARRVSAQVTNGPASSKSTASWIVARWGEHKKLADQAGSRFIGAYEGGSHMVPPKELAQSETFSKWWRSYHWGEEGADVARTVNERLIAAFPDAIIANYESIGKIDVTSPWIDGHYAKPTPMLKMWDEFARPDRLD